MVESNSDRPMRAPWHLWLVGLLATLWNGFAAFDFTATAARFEPYIRAMPPELRDYIYSRSIWHFMIWGVATWGGVIGALLLLLRQKLAVPALDVSLAGAAALFLIAIVRPEPHGMNDPTLAGIIALIALLLVAYTHWSSRRGALR